MQCRPASRPLPPHGGKAFNSDQPELGATAADLRSILIFRRIVPARDRLETPKFLDGDATRRGTIALKRRIVLDSCKTLCATFGKNIMGELRISVERWLGNICQHTFLCVPSAGKPR